MGVESICSRAFGARLDNSVRMIIKLGIIVLLLTSLPIASLWMNMDKTLLMLKHDKKLASEAHINWETEAERAKNLTTSVDSCSTDDEKGDDNFELTQGHPQVFLNFRGEQLRYSFVSHLVDAFERNCIPFFIDSKEQRGKDLQNLFLRIQESTIALAIFSTRYAESSWCLDELVKMKKLSVEGNLIVIPVFYKVEAREVRKQTGEFGDNFWTLARGDSTSGNQIREWKEALEDISNNMGLSLGEKKSEADFVKEIVEAVQNVLATIRLEEEEKHSSKKKRKNYKRKLQNSKRSRT